MVSEVLINQNWSRYENSGINLSLSTRYQNVKSKF